MDIVSIASTPVPAYFIIAPIVIVLVVLLVLIIKPSSKQTSAVITPVALGAVAAGTQQSVQEMAPVQQSSQESQPPKEVAQPVQAVNTTVVESSSAVTPTPAAPAASSSLQGEIPPVSSWKPKDPIATIIVEDVAGLTNTPSTVESTVSTTAIPELVSEVISPEQILASANQPENQPLASTPLPQPNSGQSSTQAVPTF